MWQAALTVGLAYFIVWMIPVLLIRYGHWFLVIGLLLLTLRLVVFGFERRNRW
jgi:hypothetical protein